MLQCAELMSRKEKHPAMDRVFVSG